MAAANEWDTDPYGDPTLGGGNPWMTPAPTGTGTGDPSQSLEPSPGGAGAQTSAPPPPTATPTATPTPDDYDAHLTKIALAPTPVTQAAAQDDLARRLQTDLEADGHAVKWTDATTLSIDGRQYELGGTVTPAAAAGGGIDTGAGGTGDYDPGNPPPNLPPPPPSDIQPPAAPAGRMDDAAILAQIAKWAQMEGADPSLASDPAYWLNAIKTRGGLGDDNRQYWQDAGVGPTAFFRNPNRETGGTSSVGADATAGNHTDPTYPAWSPSAPTYTPDFIDTSASELPNFNDILGLLDTPAPGDAELQQLVQNIVEHPETLTDQDIERLKAKSAEEAAVASQSQDEELQHFGYSAGLDSSPWLAGQRAQNAWDRSNTTITGNRNIDIAAADRRQSDRQSAAAIGEGFSSFKSSQKAQAVGLAVTAALGKAGEQRSRAQLNESLKQAATQLGLTKDNLVMTYLNHAMDDLTKNKQIDLNFDVDMKKLAEQSDEFKQTLLQRIHELQQADDQFRAQYGLDLQKFQHQKDQDAWTRAQAAAGV